MLLQLHYYYYYYYYYYQPCSGSVFRLFLGTVIAMRFVQVIPTSAGPGTGKKFREFPAYLNLRYALPV